MEQKFFWVNEPDDVLCPVDAALSQSEPVLQRHETFKRSVCRPFLKWAGGKTQLLDELLSRAPLSFNRYIEPFVGGGAMFFALRPERALIADSNGELINVYRQVADNVDMVIKKLAAYRNTEDCYYSARELDWESMEPYEAAARTIFLNKTCFNGLYRVNHKGQFNVPYGWRRNPKICDVETLYAASEALQNAEIVCGDYIATLETYAQSGDFLFLDPPYIPVSKYSDFKRYTKEQFSEDDHRALAEVVKRMHKRGCYVLLTNSNHPLVHELYADFKVEVVQTKRNISCNGKKRTSEDVIVTACPARPVQPQQRKLCFPSQLAKYPSTRFMGAKSKLTSIIDEVSRRFDYDKAVDLFSGSGIVGYLFKTQGRSVVCNDYMTMCSTFARAMIENNSTTLPLEVAEDLLKHKRRNNRFVAKNFAGLYFSESDNDLIDDLRVNIGNLRDEYQRAIAMTALIRACLKKRPRGVFTYTGDRYNDGRKDLQKTLRQHFLEAVNAVNNAVFDNGKNNRAINGNALDYCAEEPSLVYIDPPYYSPYSDNEYVRRYHFVEGLARDWNGVEIQYETKTHKFKSYPTPFSTRTGATEAFNYLFERLVDCTLIVSYSSNSLPSKEEMTQIMSRYKRHVEVIPIDYKYSFGNQRDAETNRNAVQEYLFVGY